MEKAPDLPDLDASKSLTERDLIANDLDGKKAYKVLQDKDNRLIDHVQHYCQNH